VLIGAMAMALAAPASAQDEPSADMPFPAVLAGETLEVETFSGPEYVAQFSSGEGADPAFVEGTEALVDSVGKTLDDLSVKTALYQPSEGNHAVIAGFRIDGTDAREFAPQAIQLLLGDVATPELRLRPVAGKWVLRVVDATMPGVYPRTVFINDDTAWIIEGDEQYVWDALDQLPGVDPAGALAEDQMIANLPLELDGRRRTGLYEATEPLFLPTLSEHLGEPLEQWLLDLYLEAGLTPAEMIGVVTWWGVETSQDSVQIEGYRLPGENDELVARLVDEVILGAGAAPADGVSRTEQTLGGREVTTLDFGSIKQHVFSSGDTAWVVTDNVDEAEMTEEAIAALP
jgi:hypothetical protein